MINKTQGKEKPKRERSKEVLLEKFYEELFEKKRGNKTRQNCIWFFSKCFLVNQLIIKVWLF